VLKRSGIVDAVCPDDAGQAEQDRAEREYSGARIADRGGIPKLHGEWVMSRRPPATNHAPSSRDRIERPWCGCDAVRQYIYLVSLMSKRIPSSASREKASFRDASIGFHKNDRNGRARIPGRIARRIGISGSRAF
jgi:hypothetical protein